MIAGAPDYHSLVRPYSIATDSRGRIIVTDPGAAGVHIFDFTAAQVQVHPAPGRDKDTMLDAAMRRRRCPGQHLCNRLGCGRDFCLRRQAESISRAIGSLKGGEGYFKRPTGIAVDSAAQRIYVTDTLRDQVFVLDMQGNVLADHRQDRRGRGRIQSPHRAAAGRAESDGRGRHELPRAGV